MELYRVVIVESCLSDREKLAGLLESEGHTVVARGEEPSVAVAALQTHKVDAILLDEGLAAMSGERLFDLAATVLLSQATSDIRQISTGRAMGFLVKPASARHLTHCLSIAVQRYRELRQLQEELRDARDRLDTRKLVDRAKGILMRTHEIPESEAFRLIQQRSMNSRTSMRRVAEQIVAGNGPS